MVVIMTKAVTPIVVTDGVRFDEVDLVAGNARLHSVLSQLWDKLSLGSDKLRNLLLGDSTHPAYGRSWVTLTESINKGVAAGTVTRAQEQLFQQMLGLRDIYQGVTDAQTWLGQSAVSGGERVQSEIKVVTEVAQAPVLHEAVAESAEVTQGAPAVEVVADLDAAKEHQLAQEPKRSGKKSVKQAPRRQRSARTTTDAAACTPRAGVVAFKSSITLRDGDGVDLEDELRTVHRTSARLTDLLQDHVHKKLAQQGVTFRGPIPFGILVNLGIVSLLANHEDVQGLVSLSDDDQLVLDILNEHRSVGWQESVNDALDEQAQQMAQINKTLGFLHKRSVQNERDNFFFEHLLSAFFAERLMIGDIATGSAVEDIDLHSEKHEKVLAVLKKSSEHEWQRGKDVAGRQFHAVRNDD
ncbi:hypothetical protein H2C43_07085 [Corynebacterium glutamicum]|uniref:Uncharacterized protein n=2 Tax=Corynebacterium glutamicum TaxID=1718 RepID=Q8NPG3_CORGL|nr:hypothetical protein CYL77_09355 [Corynebacterium glutamicum]CCH24996.1 hypothetical protein WA5_1776 [Corynebacterium glutamicum K051]BAB99243.1 Hypothetical protein [Corynebacterium glutamicum ATCC 13032]AUI04979.1 hypothetical protein C0I99_13050 [Corynebacterium glutamicum]MBA4571771.1 hypothetical protein [Corynebacterium glutamicum]